MRFFFITILCLFFSEFTGAQNYNFPKNAEKGKCYERCFYYDKPVVWKEIECKRSNQESNNEINVFDVRKSKKEQIKFIKYQEKLIKLGYKLNANGFLDKETVKAHHRYLKDKAKIERKRKRKNRN